MSDRRVACYTELHPSAWPDGAWRRAGTLAYPFYSPAVFLNLDESGSHPVGASIVVHAQISDPSYSVIHVSAPCGTPQGWDSSPTNTRFAWDTHGCNAGQARLFAKASGQR